MHASPSSKGYPGWCTDETLDFSEVLRLGLSRRGLTLSRTQARIAELGDAISVSTLSHWQSGRSLPGRRVSTTVLSSLEQVLDLPESTLTRALHRTVERKRTASAERVQLARLIHRGAEVQKVFDKAGVTFNDSFSRLTVMQRLTLQPSGARQTLETTLTLRAEEDGAHAFGNFQVDPPDQGPLSVFEVVYGCTLHQMIHDEEHRVSVAEFRLPEPLSRGALTTVSFVENYPPSDNPVRSAGRVHRTAFRDCVTEVCFHPDKLPARVEQFFEPADSERVTSPDIFENATTYGQRPLLGTVAQAYTTGRGPGLSGLRWLWPEDIEESAG